MHSPPEGGIKQVNADAFIAMGKKHEDMDLVMAPGAFPPQTGADAMFKEGGHNAYREGTHQASNRDIKTSRKIDLDDNSWDAYNFARFYSPAAAKKYTAYEGNVPERERVKWPQNKLKFEETLPTYTWNLDVIGYPAAICTCYTIEHVQAVVNFAREYCEPRGILLAVTSGRHSRSAMPDNALVLDLSGMKDVTFIGGKDNVIKVSGGSCLHDIDLCCNKNGTCMPLGGCPSTGCGLVLLGGFGHFSRKYGMSLDHILEVTVVTADGSVRVCNDEQNQELLWANKGGTGNFGVVCEMKLKTHKMNFYKDVPGGSGTNVLFHERVVFPWGKFGFIGRKQILMDAFMERLQEDDKYYAETGDAKCGAAHVVLVMGGPCITWQVWHGDSLDEGKKYFEASNQKLRPALAPESKIEYIDYHKDVQWSKFPFSKAASCYLTEVLFEKMSPELLDVVADCVTTSTISKFPWYPKLNKKSMQEPVIHTQNIGGEASNTNNDSKDAFCLRKYRYWFLMIGCIDHTLPKAEYDAQKQATREYFQWIKSRLEPFKSSGVADPYTGHQLAREADESGTKMATENSKKYCIKDGSACYILPDKMRKLQRIKAKYDPKNMFCINANIKPVP